MRIVNFILYSSLWIALAASAATCFTAYYTKTIEGLSPLIYMVFFATVFGYNFQRILKYWKSEPGGSVHQNWILKNRIVLIVICLIAFQAMLIIAARHFELFLRWWPEAIVSVIAVVLYSFPIYRNKGLRNVPGIKILLVASVWTLITGWLPMKFSVQIDSFAKLFMLTDRFLLIFLLCIPFDIRDLKFDDRNMKTIPQLIGIKSALYLAIALAAILSILPFWFAPELFPVSVPFYFLVILSLHFSQKLKSDTYHLLALDGLIGLQALIYLIYMG